MKHYFILIFSSFIFFTSNAQQKEDFEKEFPTLIFSSTDTSWFTENGYLKSRFTGVKKSSVFALNNKVKNQVWNIHLKIEANPSSTNFTDIFLSSSLNTFESTLVEGYFVRLGGTKDEIGLYKRISGKNILLIDGTDGFLNKSNNDIYLTISCSESYNWTLEYKDNLSTASLFSNTVTDSLFFKSAYKGIYTQYSGAKTILNTFSYDYFYQDSLILDTEAPLINKLTVLNDSLIIDFNEKIDTSFSLNPIIKGNTEFKYHWNSTVKVSIPISKLENGLYTLTVSVRDLLGNSATITKDFSVYKPQKSDILFSELMIDPNPVINLPESEYIELWNTKSVPVSLQNWELRNGTQKTFLPDSIIKPNERVILIPSSQSSNWKEKMISVKTIPLSISTTYLTNTAFSVSLYSNTNLLIDSINYNSTTWESLEGGKSYELVHEKERCKENENWKISKNSSGGTPAEINSTITLPFDNKAPILVGYTSDDENYFFNFNEKLFSVQLLVNNKPLENTYYEKTIKCKKSFINDSITIRVSDCIGNTLDSVLLIEKSRKPIPGDLIINEFKNYETDEDTWEGQEYIELENTSNDILDLENITYSDKVSAVNLPFYKLGPKQSVILCKKGLEHLFPIKNSLALATWPAINASSEILIFKNSSTILIQFSYLNEFLISTDSLKSYSFQRLVNTACGNYEWVLRKGTPGVKNGESLKMNKLKSINWNKDSLFVQFESELVNSNLEIKVGNKLQQYTNTTSLIHFVFETSIPIGEKVPVYIKGTICNKNIDTNFVLYNSPKIKKNEVLFSEILFNPKKDGVDFIEIYNNSTLDLNLNGLVLARRKNGIITEKCKVSINYLLESKSVLAICEDTKTLCSQYKCNETNVLKISKIPTMTDEMDSLLILFEDTILEELAYNQKMHSSILDDKEGVSLERINYQLPSYLSNNWLSASSNSGFATPGYLNSQAQSLEITRVLNLSSSIISPNGDGHQDFLQVSVNETVNGGLLNCWIYDLQGNMRYRLANNMLLGSVNLINWEGIDFDGNVLPVNQYILYAEITHPDKSTIIERKLVVIADYLK